MIALAAAVFAYTLGAPEIYAGSDGDSILRCSFQLLDKKERMSGKNLGLAAQFSPDLKPREVGSNIILHDPNGLMQGRASLRYGFDESGQVTLFSSNNPNIMGVSLTTMKKDGGRMLGAYIGEDVGGKLQNNGKNTFSGHCFLYAETGNAKALMAQVSDKIKRTAQ